MDFQLQALGPGGLDKLLLELATSRSQLAQLESLRDGLQAEVQGSETARLEVRARASLC